VSSFIRYFCGYFSHSVGLYLETDLETDSPLTPFAVCVTPFRPTLMLSLLPSLPRASIIYMIPLFLFIVPLAFGSLMNKLKLPPGTIYSLNFCNYEITLELVYVPCACLSCPLSTWRMIERRKQQ
jgi:hypothetical protein